MSPAAFNFPRLLSKWTPRHRALPVALVLALLLPALAPRAAEAGWLDDLWAGFRWLWAEQGVQIDPLGRPAPEPRNGVSAIWAAEGWQIDPGGLKTPVPPPTDSPDRP